jgi:hypothetical protein
MNPIIFLWAHPRSMSTALERVMRERGDFDCLHEPFLHYYYLQKSKHELPHFDVEAGHPSTYSETRDWILERAERAPVFAKDMSYYIMPELLDEDEFCRRLRHCFLIRDPRRAILSYFRLDSAVSRDEIGLEAQWRHLEGLRRIGIGDSLVLEAEEIQRDVRGSIGRWWRELGLEFIADAFSWDRDRAPQDWNYVEGWHGNVSASQGIEPPREDDIAEQFDRVCREAPQLHDYLQHHDPSYRRLRALSLTREEGHGAA